MVFTDTGITKLLSFLSGAAETSPTHIAVGTDTTAADVTDTALGTEVDRQAIDSNSTVGAEITFIGLIASTTANGNTLTEVGLFNDPTAGDCYVRSVHGSIVKTANVEIQYEITIRGVN